MDAKIAKSVGIVVTLLAAVTIAAFGLPSGAVAQNADRIPSSDLSGAIHLPRRVVTPANGVHPASTQCFHLPYDYAMQYTATDTAQPHDGCGIGVNVYSGWLGIDGQITTPSTVPYMGNDDHAVGWIGKYDMSGRDSWLQIGWYTGRISGGSASGSSCLQDCFQRNGTFGMYVEYQYRGAVPANDIYIVRDLGDLAPGQKVTYRVEYAPQYGTGCWAAYFNYNTMALHECGLGTQGAMYAVNELLNNSATASMPASEFGTNSPGTNQTLRLKNGTGAYENWDQSLTAGGTRQNDERGNLPGENYVMSSHQLWWDLNTYGN